MSTDFTVYGRHLIPDNALKQMEQACSLPVAVAGSLQADAHLGYGLPIGGVLGLDNAVCPYAVGVDIACRMKLSVFDLPAEDLDTFKYLYIQALEQNTHFGVGVTHPDLPGHEVLSEDWEVSPVTTEHYGRAVQQLGTSGSGNHFVEWGEFEGRVALLSHSGSRGVGAKVCNYYSKAAKDLMPEYGELAWLDLHTELGQEYWAAMNLMGKYAAANHDIIHDSMAYVLDEEPTVQIENHHNFAWKEVHGGKEMIVHRKGATPAAKGEVGIIPGSMGSPTFIVEGLGNEDSLCSSSHGAGRLMSRRHAKKSFDYDTEIKILEDEGITVLSAGADEVVGAYKDIHEVMHEQKDLVHVLGEFNPKIVKMCP